MLKLAIGLWVLGTIVGVTAIVSMTTIVVLILKGVALGELEIAWFVKSLVLSLSSLAFLRGTNDALSFLKPKNS